MPEEAEVKIKKPRRARTYRMFQLVGEDKLLSQIATAPTLKKLRATDLMVDGENYVECVQIGDPFTAKVETIQKVSRARVK